MITYTQNNIILTDIYYLQAINELGFLLYIKWNLIRLGGPAHGIMTKTVHKTLPGGGGGPGGGWVRGIGVVEIQEVGGVGGAGGPVGGLLRG